MKNEYLFKVLIIGELGTGKTSIIKRYVQNAFAENYKATIGVDFALKVINWNERTIIRLQLWDIAGQERFGNMTRVYYKDSNAAFIVFDSTRQDSFEAVVKWKKDLDSKVLMKGEPIPAILLANKCDLLPQDFESNNKVINEFCKNNGFIEWFPVSAKTGEKIDESANFLIKTILDANNWSSEPRSTIKYREENPSRGCKC